MDDLGITDKTGDALPGLEPWSSFMQEFDAVLSDLEWRRVRRRVTMHPAVAFLRNFGTLALIVALKLASPALAR
jgi:hypothetical protein